MAQFASKTRNTDPQPWMNNTTGERSARPPRVAECHYVPRAEFAANTTQVNPILEAFRDEWPSEPNAYTTHEWLYQLARHWAEWQGPRIGTFPIPGTYIAGEVATREESEESGEDRVYWEIQDALERFRKAQPSNTADDITPTARLIQDAIVHATAVLDRLDNWATANGQGIA